MPDQHADHQHNATAPNVAPGKCRAVRWDAAPLDVVPDFADPMKIRMSGQYVGESTRAQRRGSISEAEKHTESDQDE